MGAGAGGQSGAAHYRYCSNKPSNNSDKYEREAGVTNVSLSYDYLARLLPAVSFVAASATAALRASLRSRGFCRWASIVSPFLSTLVVFLLVKVSCVIVAPCERAEEEGEGFAMRKNSKGNVRRYEMSACV